MSIQIDSAITSNVLILAIANRSSFDGDITTATAVFFNFSN